MWREQRSYLCVVNLSVKIEAQTGWNTGCVYGHAEVNAIHKAKHTRKKNCAGAWGIIFRQMFQEIPSPMSGHLSTDLTNRESKPSRHLGRETDLPEIQSEVNSRMGSARWALAPTPPVSQPPLPSLTSPGASLTSLLLPACVLHSPCSLPSLTPWWEPGAWTILWALLKKRPKMR